MATRFLELHQTRPDYFDRSARGTQSSRRVRLDDKWPAAHVFSSTEPRWRGAQREREPEKGIFFRNEMKKVDESYYKAQKLLIKKADHKAIRGKVEKRMAEERKCSEELSAHQPEFVIGLRPHTVWEKMNVTLSCIVQGAPSPQVNWYKDGILIKPSEVPGKYTVENKIGLHTLEISRCSPKDSGEYSALATNIHGEAMSYATVLVNKYEGSDAGGASVRLEASQIVPDFTIIDGFGVSFGKEGDSLTLSCIFSTALSGHLGEISWLRDGVLLQESNWLKIETSNLSTTLTLTHIHKEDEGLYTMCLLTQTGYREHSGYVFVRDAPAAEPGAAGSPLDVECQDVNKDYVLVTWKPPSADGGSPVIGYLIDRKEVGSEEWCPCNHIPEKRCKFPAVGLSENRTYQFRVQAVNSAGISRPSRVSDPVTTVDASAANRIMRIPTNRGEIVITKDELEDVHIPLPPTNLRVSEIGQTYAVLQWNEPVPRGREPLIYYVEKSVVGSDIWQRENLDIPVNCPRFAALDLDRRKMYCFRVCAVNKYGISEPSQPSEALSFGQTPAPLAPPHDIVPVRDTKTSVTVLWKGPEDQNELIGFYVYVCQVGTNNWEICNNKPVNSKSFTAHGLTPGKEYVFRVKAVSPAGLSDYSAESTPIIVNSSIYRPSAPYGLTQLSCGRNEMVIAWKEPKFPIEADVLGYFLDWCNAAVAEWHEVNIKPIKTRVYKMENLTEGCFYEFRAFAMNWAGVGPSSMVSDQLKCEQWTMPQPGPPFDVMATEVRTSSLLLHWQAPLYMGKDCVTGYLLEMCEAEGGEWAVLDEKPTLSTHMRVTRLEEGKTYIFRVYALNSMGAGVPSLPSDPVCAKTRPGTTEVETGVDDDGNIFLVLQCSEIAGSSKFIWSKDFEEIATPERVRVETIKDTSKLILVDPSEEDLGTYSVIVTGTDGVSSSYTLTNEELQRLKELSHQKRNPSITAKSDWAVEPLEKGTVRLWLQVESLSPAAQLRFIFNEKEVSSTPTHKINFDKASGLVEMIIQNFTEEDQGSYTAQLKDGKAQGQFTLILIDDKFQSILSQCDFQRYEWKRKQGPYFEKYLDWEVTEDCNILLSCKVTNTKTQTCVNWSKDGKQIPSATYDARTGISSHCIAQTTEKDKGLYKVIVADERGEDCSVLKMINQVFDNILQEICRIGGTSASELKIQPTAEGIKLYSVLKYNMDNMKKAWYLNNKSLESQDRRRIGSDNHQVWLQIFNPTGGDKGKYTLELFDGKQKHLRELNVSQQVFDEAISEHQRLKQAAFEEKNRAKVVKGLPDVVNVMESKTLYLSCTISGDPTPEVFWLKNDKEVMAGEHCQITVEKTSVTFTIQQVTSQDSGRYSLLVRNKYGSETAVITVGVYKCGEETREE
ncbi:myomesin-3 isoform X3 [Narcine bancroftii]|uniref:myomesin-3 isoform X3 n=1 Tax=Narcine bancroftii TaxID=1343680 RepID=UPI0038322F31